MEVDGPMTTFAVTRDVAPIVWILLPAFNEEASLPNLIPKIQHALQDLGLAYQILVYDDGSTDQTAALLEAPTSTM